MLFAPLLRSLTVIENAFLTVRLTVKSILDINFDRKTSPINIVVPKG